MSKKITQMGLVMDYFIAHPNHPIAHPELVDWVVPEYLIKTGKPFRDPDRAVRTLAQQGKLKKIEKGVYEYDPDFVINPVLADFTPSQREQIFNRDGYRCVICGKGREDGVEIQADHIKPKDLGGEAVIENGQTLCASHNFRKKNFGQTENGKKMFIRLYERAQSVGDDEIEEFCRHVLEVYEEHDINGHIEWER